MRKLRIDIKTAIWSMAEKSRLDALAFALIVKQYRVNSVVTHFTYKKIRQIFHIGHETAKRVIRDGIKYGFLRTEEDRLIACSLHNNKDYSFLIEEKWFDCAAKERDGETYLTFTKVKDIIRSVVLVNHVKKMNDVSDTHVKAMGDASPTSVRRARRRESRMLKKPFSEKFGGLSNKRIQQLLGCKHDKASRIVSSARASNLIERKVREEYLNCDPLACTMALRAYYGEGDNVVIVWREVRAARIKLSNTYRYVGNCISRSNNGGLD